MNTIGTKLRVGLISAMTLSMLAHSTAHAQATQILETYGNTLTSYKGAATSLQGVLPLFKQRGVNFDGTARRGAGFAWSFAGNSLGDTTASSEQIGDVSIGLGQFVASDVDWSGPNPGASAWVIGRSYNQLQASVNDGPQGKNWFQSSQPELVSYVNSGDHSQDVLYVVYGADRYLEFQRTSASATTYKGKNGAAGVITYVSGSPDTYIYHDQAGTRTYFFGGNTSSNRANWQIWKIVDTAGNTSFVGDATTASTAATNGYNSDKTIAVAYDASANGGRRYTYSYTTVASVSRLTQVTVETKTGGSWTSSPTGIVEIARVSYSYYSGSDANGPDGSLKIVSVRTSLSDSGARLDDGDLFLERKKYYRYYTGSYNGSTNPGNVGDLKLVMDAEGCRKYDWLDTTFNDSFTSAADSALTSYSSAYFEYPSSDHRPSVAFFNGECGCSGGINGTYNFTYEQASSYSTYTGNTSYDTNWATRTVVTRPDSTYMTQYFDETGQPLSMVVTNTAPTGSPTQTWVTEVVRDGNGRISEVHTPANITAYTHTLASVAFTRSSSVGMVTYFDRVSSGDMIGFLQASYLKKGTSGTVEYTSYTGYTSSDYQLTSSPLVEVIRPFVSAKRVYPVSGTSASTTANYNETTYAYSPMWGPGNTDIQNLVPAKVVSSSPLITTGNNGSGNAATVTQYLRTDGTQAYRTDRMESGGTTIVAYQMENASGLSTTKITDKSNASTYAVSDDPTSGSNLTKWALTLPSPGSDVKSADPTYDPQGRTDTVTLPVVGGSTRVTKAYYSRLKDGRMLTISFPDYTAGGTPTVKGPASYSVTNLAGHPEFTGTVAITSSGITAALSTWVDTTSSDPITALLRGTLSKVSTSIYSNAGTQLNESRMYFLLPGSGAGSVGTNYDSSTIGYDSMGRKWRMVGADGTITRAVFDTLGRAIEQWTGTNDFSFTGGSGSGPDNMTKVATTEYDGGASGGNSYVTTTKQDADGNWGTTGDTRTTTYTYDYRGRSIVTARPQAPHLVAKYDNMNRSVATGQYSSASGLTSSSDPTSVTSNRIALNETLYDERGQVWKTIRHKITQGTGADADNLASLTWYDAMGRVLKTKGEGSITKSVYDRQGRTTIRFTIADDGNESTYTAASSIGTNKVLEESQTYYDDGTSMPLMQATIQRWHDDASTTGALDSNADSDRAKFTEGNIAGRISISTTWYDNLNRRTTSGVYGTDGMTGAGAVVFNRSGLSAPGSSSASVLVTKTSYNDNGTLLDMTDPKALVTRYLYDGAQRKIAEIRNYTGGATVTANRDNDIYTRYVYSTGRMSQMWVDLNANGTQDSDDQVTTYTYGVTKGVSAGDSQLTSNALLKKVTYPADNPGTRVDYVTYAYDALGEQIWMQDQVGNIIETNFDTAGRTTDKRVTNLAHGFDGRVLRVSTAYLSRGLIDTVTQYDNATVGAGTATDQVAYTYDDWGNQAKINQDPDSAIGVSGRAAFSLIYTWTKRTPTNGASTIARSTLTMPAGADITYTYNTGSAMNDPASRLSELDYGGIPVAKYYYLGAATVAEADTAAGTTATFASGTPHAYGYLDAFGRVIKSKYDSNAGNVYDTDLTYDYDSNITVAKDNFFQDTSGVRRYDANYTMDNLNRLKRALEGNWNGSSISTTRRDEQWQDGSGNLALSQTGNWARHRLDLNGDGVFTGTSEMDDTGTFNKANEWLTRDTDSNSAVNYTLVHDANGNLTDDGQNYTYVYDAFGRLCSVLKRSGGATVTEYTYNGLGHRISWHYDANVDGSVNGSDPTYYFCYDERWRIVATYRGSDANPKEQFIFHAAGLRGMGGSSYIDSVVCRDKDANSGWTSASDGTLEERRYYCQNWRSDVVCITDSSGDPQEWIRYSAYGVPFNIPKGDYNCDGVLDSNDTAALTGMVAGSPGFWTDFNQDGNVDTGDTASLTAYITANSSAPGGRGKLSRGDGTTSASSLGNRIGYAGYQFDPALAGSVWHVRNRVLVSALGRWTRRDPAGYVDGMGLYQYVQGNPSTFWDSNGLCFSRDASTPFWASMIQVTSTDPDYEQPHSALTATCAYPSYPFPGTHQQLVDACHAWAACKLHERRPDLLPGTLAYLAAEGAGASCCSSTGSEGACIKTALLQAQESSGVGTISIGTTCTAACFSAAWAATCGPACGSYSIGITAVTCLGGCLILGSNPLCYAACGLHGAVCGTCAAALYSQCALSCSY